MEGESNSNKACYDKTVLNLVGKTLESRLKVSFLVGETGELTLSLDSASAYQYDLPFVALGLLICKSRGFELKILRSFLVL